MPPRSPAPRLANPKVSGSSGAAPNAAAARPPVKAVVNPPTVPADVVAAKSFPVNFSTPT